jgi:hypothetical protein
MSKTYPVGGFAVVGTAVALLVAGPGQSAPRAAGVTFTEDVAPIMFRHCTSCHRPGEAAPFSLTSYQDARPRARQIATAVKARQMPPWKADHSDFAFKNDRRLTVEHIATIERWAEAEAPEGDPKKLPPLPTFTSGWQLGTPDLVVSMPEAYQVPATGRDIYRNFVLPLNLSKDVWVKAIEFRPSDRASVHHSLFFLDNTGSARKQDEADPGPGYYGGMGGGFQLQLGARGAGAGRGAANQGGQSSTGGLGGWAPGAQPKMLPADLAFFVAKGSDLILSTHFHPSGKPGREASTVGLYFTDKAPSQGFAGVQLPPAFGALANIDIPAGEANYTISDSFVLPVDVKAFGAAPHAHYLAKRMKMTATFPSGEVKTLVSISDWDFGWQEQYQFANFVELPKGTRLDVTIGYDNSAANRRNPSNPPKRVTWGEQSTDEMGSIGIQVITANPAEMPELRQALQEHTRQKAAGRAGIGAALLLQGLGRGNAAR